MNEHAVVERAWAALEKDFAKKIDLTDWASKLVDKEVRRRHQFHHVYDFGRIVLRLLDSADNKVRRRGDNIINALTRSGLAACRESWSKEQTCRVACLVAWLATMDAKNLQLARHMYNFIEFVVSTYAEKLFFRMEKSELPKIRQALGNFLSDIGLQLNRMNRHDLLKRIGRSCNEDVRQCLDSRILVLFGLLPDRSKRVAESFKSEDASISHEEVELYPVYYDSLPNKPGQHFIPDDYKHDLCKSCVNDWFTDSAKFSRSGLACAKKFTNIRLTNGQSYKAPIGSKWNLPNVSSFKASASFNYHSLLRTTKPGQQPTANYYNGKSNGCPSINNNAIGLGANRKGAAQKKFNGGPQFNMTMAAYPDHVRKARPI